MIVLGELKQDERGTRPIDMAWQAFQYALNMSPRPMTFDETHAAFTHWWNSHPCVEPVSSLPAAKVVKR